LRNKGLILTSFFLFLIVNTNYFWEGILGILAFPFLIFRVVAFIILAIILLIQIRKGINEKFSDKKRVLTIGLVSLVLVLIYLKPYGIINFDKLKGEDLGSSPKLVGFHY